MPQPTQESPPVVDLEALHKYCGSDLQLIGELTQIFAADYPKKRAALSDAISAGASDEVREIAHALKGGLSNFFAARATAVAMALEQAAKDNKSAEFARLSVELHGQIECLVSALQKHEASSFTLPLNRMES